MVLRKFILSTYQFADEATPQGRGPRGRVQTGSPAQLTQNHDVQPEEQFSVSTQKIIKTVLVLFLLFETINRDNIKYYIILSSHESSHFKFMMCHGHGRTTRIT